MPPAAPLLSSLTHAYGRLLFPLPPPSRRSSSSSSPASEALAALRRDTLALLRADGRHYEVVITAGATAALRLVRVGAWAFAWFVCVFWGWGGLGV